MRIEAVPVVRLGDRIPGPVGKLEVLEDDPRFLVALGRVTPDVKITVGAARRRAARALKPWMLVRGMVEHQLGDDPQPSFVRRAKKSLEVVQRAAVGMDAGIVGD